MDFPLFSVFGISLLLSAYMLINEDGHTHTENINSGEKQMFNLGQ